MREYGKIHSSFWTSQDIRDAGEDGRTLAAYLLTSPHSNMLGCFRVPLAYVSDDLKWPLERVLEGFEKLTQRVWLTFDKGSEWVVIHKFLKWNQPENPNVVRASEKLFAQIPGSSNVKAILAGVIAEFEPRFSVDKLAEFKPFPNPFDTSAKGYRKPEPEPEPLPEPEPEPEPQPEPKNTREANPKSSSRAAVELPEWIPEDAWTAFVAMRKKIKAPLTDDAVKLAVTKLEKLMQAGHRPRAVLEQSTLNSWRGLFEVRAARDSPGSAQSREAFNERENAKAKQLLFGSEVDHAA
jgi:hypothetical protein